MLGGCGNSDDESSGKEDAALATVAVINHSGGREYEGSGTIYDADRGLVLTSATVVWDRDSLDVVTGDGERIKGRLVARSPCRDLAVILLGGVPADLSEIKLGHTDGLAAGDDVTALGFARSGNDRFRIAETTGPVSAPSVDLEIDETLPPHPGLLAHQAPVSAAAAGGPLVTESGEWVGVNSVLPSYADNPDIPAGLFYAVTSDYAREKLAQLKPRRHAYWGGWKNEHECHYQFQALVRKHRGTVVSERRRRQKMGEQEMHHENSDKDSMSGDEGMQDDSGGK